MTSLPSAPSPAGSRPWWRRALLMLGKLALLAIGIWLVVKAIVNVDWAQVGGALARLTWWEMVVIAALVAVRQTVNASTLPVLVPGLSMPHALSTALAGTLIQTFTPPPADTVLRLSMLKSYGVEPTRGAAALVLDTAVFYLARFVAPIVGLVLAVLFLPVEAARWWMTAIGVAGCAVLIWALWMITRGESAASRLGETAARLIKRLRPTVDPAAWADAVIRFQRESAAGLARKVAKATPIMLAFVLADGLVMLACLRFVGVPAGHVSYLAVIAALFTFYPLTIFPFAGLGVLDAAVIVLINAEGLVDAPDLVAAMVIWRAATLILPLFPGLASLGIWRAREGKRAAVTATTS